MSSHALFFAVKPDAAAAAKLLALGRRLREHHGLKGRLFDAARLHVTLHFFGRFPALDDALVQGLCRGADEVRAEPFALRFDHVGSFARPSNAPLVMRTGDGAPGAKALHQHLAAALVHHGVGTRPERRFVPHLTLLYDDKSLPELEVDPIEWTANTFDLVHSESGQGHRVLRQWPLRAV
ncbi:RNA 2',3'-cyclic phosphodiesterase [Piscinibacter terrae]|uniref:RNA 2',3'-cyclic phosphodiesterase n=1 Tax=Piscinibacter terrae TaxID=2496871 RepID=A0A3N7HQL2_9BURK|nr:RNA 2',3'-cyclic phosphodiesterase [Albitalea terrae]RQP23456.1 RNA 2',3'-cyclic phosphodiesterase [Albitalea terrae]